VKVNVSSRKTGVFLGGFDAEPATNGAGYGVPNAAYLLTAGENTKAEDSNEN
jgi:hypothetical protein